MSSTEGLSASDIEHMSDEEFKVCIVYLGETSGLSDEAATGTMEKIRRIHGDVSEI